MTGSFSPSVILELFVHMGMRLGPDASLHPAWPSALPAALRQFLIGSKVWCDEQCAGCLVVMAGLSCKHQNFTGEVNSSTGDPCFTDLPFLRLQLSKKVFQLPILPSVSYRIESRWKKKVWEKTNPIRRVIPDDYKSSPSDLKSWCVWHKKNNMQKLDFRYSTVCAACIL